MVVDSWVVWGIGIVGVIVLAVTGYWCVARLAPPRWRRPWSAVAITFIAGLIAVSVIDTSLYAPRALAELDSQVGLPANYTGDRSSLILRKDGSATLTNVVLADDVTKNGEGRWCLSGEPVTISGDARWSMSSDGAARIDANGKVSQLFPDPKLILGYGWVKGFLLTTCDVPLATEYWAHGRD
ncbi:hypothetical protein [Microbacterium sp. P03]|uniref:hypothetical protein n=1 Tax=Microbacterium sp. P03 TaxID=3366946 RepID=UPI0037460631